MPQGRVPLAQFISGSPRASVGGVRCALGFSRAHRVFRHNTTHLL
ncbi:hypothetical protein Pd630_LPD03758 [Rhodococcus opacus PD630]|nr:hypothetical protein Pd630_LPD03758 [Rhodococcus opacus PD630]